jgi:hypothetical protein
MNIPLNESAKGDKMSSNVKTACLLLALAGASQNAYSVNCYQIIDRDNSSIYSSTQPPFPMAGPEWTDGQQRLRATGRHLLWFDTNTCPIQTSRSVSIIMGTGDVVARTGASRSDSRARAARMDRG